MHQLEAGEFHEEDSIVYLSKHRGCLFLHTITVPAAPLPYSFRIRTWILWEDTWQSAGGSGRWTFAIYSLQHKNSHLPGGKWTQGTFKDGCCYKNSKMAAATGIQRWLLLQGFKDSCCYRNSKMAAATGIQRWLLQQEFKDGCCYRSSKIAAAKGIQRWLLLQELKEFLSILSNYSKKVELNCS